MDADDHRGFTPIAPAALERPTATSAEFLLNGLGTLMKCVLAQVEPKKG